MRIETDESHDLISAEKVDGTNVYSNEGSDMGSVKSVMINKRSGQVEHAVLSVGGFLGMGSEYHTIPWDKLKYDTSSNGYKLNVTEDQLRSGSTFPETDASLSEVAVERVYSHYGSTPYYA